MALAGLAGSTTFELAFPPREGLGLTTFDQPTGGRRGRARALLLQVATASRLRRPLLSIVVPVYNVEGYLSECLESILCQPMRDLEVILVDDGSTDSSGRIATRFARSSPRVRLLRQANAGLGAARNAGARAARGHMLAFVDSDDTLPSDAYTHMVSTLERTGSDFVVGKLVRDRDGVKSAMPLMRRNHERQRLAITLEEMPEILADVFAVNKVFRRSFWDDAGLSFPDRLRYEDQIALTSAFLTAGRIDVLRDTVYHWRVRPDRTSITQRRHEIEDLRDRLLTKQMTHGHGARSRVRAHTAHLVVNSGAGRLPALLPVGSRLQRRVLGHAPRRPTSAVGAVSDPLH